MTSTGVRLFSQDEYHRMTAAGILKPDERVELLEGQILFPEIEVQITQLFP